MEQRTLTRTAILWLVASVVSAGAAVADEGGMTNCELTFSLKGWSAFYKTAKGSGTVTCDNGQTAPVTIHTKGGGITFGKTEITDGRGTFSEVRDIDEVLGSYARAEAHAGAGKSAAAQAMTKGEVSLALSGTGRGVDVGFAFGSFTIERAGGGDTAEE